MDAGLIISGIVFLGIVYSGYLNGLFSSAATLLMLTVSIAIAVEFHEGLASLGPVQGMGDYALPLSMAVLFIVGYLLLAVTANVFAPPTVHMRRSVNKLGGMGLSLVTATITSGFLGLICCMTPWTGPEGRSFIGVDVVGQGISRMTREAGGRVFDAEGLFSRLKEAEGDRVCYRNMEDILVRLSDMYSNTEYFNPLTQKNMEDAIEKGTNLPVDGASEGKGVGPGEMNCPCSQKRYAIKLLKDIPRQQKDKKMQMYDPEPCHALNGNPERMVLWVWNGWDGKRVRVQGKVELIPEEKFQELIAAEK